MAWAKAAVVPHAVRMILADVRAESPEDLMARFRATGEAAAFDALVERFLGPALGVARELLHDHALAEDAVQEAFVRIVQSRRRYRPGHPFAPWFYTILHNVCTDMIRRQGREAKLAEAYARQVQAELPTGPKEESPAAVARRLLEGLPLPERQVLTLRGLHGMALSDVAAALGISHDAARKRAQRGLKRLREKNKNVPFGHHKTY
jgi:RNA polymerase sigma-70 factor, ECF subfamily